MNLRKMYITYCYKNGSIETYFDTLILIKKYYITNYIIDL